MAILDPVLNGDSGLEARNKINSNDALINADAGQNANDITDLESQVVTVDLEVNKSANFTKAFAALTKIEAIDFKHVLTSPSVSLGTTPGGTELMPLLPVPSGEVLNVPLNKTYVGSQTVYITISGGNVDVEFYYRTNRFTP